MCQSFLHEFKTDQQASKLSSALIDPNGNEGRRFSTRILLVSLDIELGELRRKVLSSAGFLMSMAHSPGATTDMLLFKPDIFMVGHTLSTIERNELMAKCRVISPLTSIVAMKKAGSSDYPVMPDLVLDGLEGPEALIRELKAIAYETMRARAVEMRRAAESMHRMARILRHKYASRSRHKALSKMAVLRAA